MTDRLRKFLFTLTLWFTIVALILIVMYQQHGPYRKLSLGSLLKALIPASESNLDRKMPVPLHAMRL